jgi:transcriptional regulator with XRE-family HTH domain
VGAIFSQGGDKRRSSGTLGGKQWPQMITSRQVRAALRKLRTDANLTPEEFADEASVHRATVYRIEKMEKTNYPRIETISALVESRGLTVTAFFARIEGVTNLESPPETTESGPRLVDPDSQEFAELLDRKAAEAVDRYLHLIPPAESRSARFPATRTKSGSGRRR